MPGELLPGDNLLGGHDLTDDRPSHLRHRGPIQIALCDAGPTRWPRSAERASTWGPSNMWASQCPDPTEAHPVGP
ncbi:hypothetical protein CONPUDRAFT_160685 [Coniophora puteana RWD-64-598 SS2]|uniref:Uncharacterized protein n=1 Tax=Coniophora puteana (strain RWD-64-598) TaxID=741705 RepID=R7SFG1_CONPW|nr:uncharacterized protein CONPUDRAFT_160685 [Coniophora puteana RWD-64-598 SS2]EIW73814.1 hypothetical protein CONPUDRAFT_160685 [Coniophora puteana RWD-64-598 SS2]